MSPLRRTVVKMFMPEFAPKVKDGTKTQTLRPKPKKEKDIPRVGDLFSGREWSGRPYHSKQIPLRDGEITEVYEATVAADGITTPAGKLDSNAEHAFAQADGFTSFGTMREWFEKRYGLPFTGVLTKWKPDPI